MKVGDLVTMTKGNQIGIVIALRRFMHIDPVRQAEVLWPHGGTSKLREDIFKVKNESR